MAESDSTLVTNPASAIPLLPNEAERIAALHSYHILDTAEEKDFDDLTELASAICQTPVALVSLVDTDRQWFKSHKGTNATETPKVYSFCAHAIAAPDPVMIIGDATKDERFSDNPAVTGDPRIAFYAGVPLINKDGFALGSLCVIDTKVRELSQTQISALLVIAKQVIDKLELRRTIMELETSNKKLRDSENRFRTLVSEAPIAIAIYSGNNLVIEQANEQMLNLLGRKNDIIGMPLLIARPEIEGHPYLDVLRGVMTTGKEHVGFGVKAPVLKNGKIKEGYFDAAYRPIANDDGIVKDIIVVVVDVTEQVEGRKAIEETNERLAIALDAGELGSYDANLATGIMLCNDQCKRNFGLPAGSAFHFADLVNAILPEYREYVQERVEHAIATNTHYHAEYQVKWPDGSLHWISAHGKPRYDDAGKIDRMIGVTSDITESKLNEQRRDDFLSIASHELKTPITSLKAALQLLNLIKDRPYSPMHIKLIEQSNRSMEKMSKLIDDLLNVNRMTEGQLKLEKKTFNVSAMLTNSCNHVRMAGKHDFILQGDKDVTIYADEHRVEQVVVNFVNNAVKYAPQSKEIYLIIEKLDDGVKIAVKDSGTGIPQDKLPYLFNRYYRADHSGTHYTGLGLGLYICSEIVKRHGGQVGAESELGKGSTFWFTLPQEDENS